MDRSEVRGVGIAVLGHETDHLELELDEASGDAPALVGMSELVAMSGMRALEESRATAMKFAACPEHDAYWGKYRKAYHDEHGPGDPPVYRVRIAVEIEELPADETAAWWRARRDREKADLDAFLAERSSSTFFEFVERSARETEAWPQRKKDAADSVLDPEGFARRRREQKGG